MCNDRKAMQFYEVDFLLTSSGVSGNWIEIAYGTSSGAVRVIVQHPETVGSGPQLFQTFTVHRSPVTKIMLSEKHLVSGEWAESQWQTRENNEGEDHGCYVLSCSFSAGGSVRRQQPRSHVDGDPLPRDDFHPAGFHTLGLLQNTLVGGNREPRQLLFRKRHW